MTKKILTILLALAMLTATACTSENSSEPTNNSSATDSSYIDSSSENSSESTPDSSSDSESENTTTTSETTTTTTTTSATTTTKNSTTTTTTTQATTTTKNTTQATQKPVQTTTTRYVAPAPKNTTTTTAKRAVATTTTAKQNTNSNVKPSGLTRLEDAVWELSFYGKDTNTTYLNIVRDELIKYGQAYCKSNPTCFKLFTVNNKLYPYYDKNGKPIYAACDMKGNNIAVGSNVEFPYDEINAPFNYSTSQERLQACRAFINRMQLLIERVLCNALHHGIANMEWYITYGFEAAGTDWVVMAHKPDSNRVYF